MKEDQENTMINGMLNLLQHDQLDDELHNLKWHSLPPLPPSASLQASLKAPLLWCR